MPQAPFALDAATDASLASLGSLGDVRRHGGHHRNLSAIPELAESGEGSGGAAARTAAGTTPWWPAVAPTHAAAAAAALQPSPEPAQPVQLRREQLRRPSPPSAGRSVATQAFYTAASEAPLPLMDENSCACTSDSPEGRHAAAAAAAAYKSTAAAAYKSTATAAGVHSQAPAGQAAQHSTTLCGITRQAPGRRQSVGGRAGGVAQARMQTSRIWAVYVAERSWACLVLKNNCPELHIAHPFLCRRTWQGIWCGALGSRSLQAGTPAGLAQRPWCPCLLLHSLCQRAVGLPVSPTVRRALQCRQHGDQRLRQRGRWNARLAASELPPNCRWLPAAHPPPRWPLMLCSLPWPAGVARQRSRPPQLHLCRRCPLLWRPSLPTQTPSRWLQACAPCLPSAAGRPLAREAARQIVGRTAAAEAWAAGWTVWGGTRAAAEAAGGAARLEGQHCLGLCRRPARRLRSCRWDTRAASGRPVRSCLKLAHTVAPLLWLLCPC